uniref:Uncharacterized protein n=1 Tax=Salix viminalis TaxID=40686 RepID=A0A6N2MHY2_SALVM
MWLILERHLNHPRYIALALYGPRCVVYTIYVIALGSKAVHEPIEQEVLTREYSVLGNNGELQICPGL